MVDKDLIHSVAILDDNYDLVEVLYKNNTIFSLECASKGYKYIMNNGSILDTSQYNIIHIDTDFKGNIYYIAKIKPTEKPTPALTPAPTPPTCKGTLVTLDYDISCTTVPIIDCTNSFYYTNYGNYTINDQSAGFQCNYVFDKSKMVCKPDGKGIGNPTCILPPPPPKATVFYYGSINNASPYIFFPKYGDYPNDNYDAKYTNGKYFLDLKIDEITGKPKIINPDHEYEVYYIKLSLATLMVYNISAGYENSPPLDRTNRVVMQDKLLVDNSNIYITIADTKYWLYYDTSYGFCWWKENQWKGYNPKKDASMLPQFFENYINDPTPRNLESNNLRQPKHIKVHWLSEPGKNQRPHETLYAPLQTLTYGARSAPPPPFSPRKYQDGLKWYDFDIIKNYTGNGYNGTFSNPIWKIVSKGTGDNKLDFLTVSADVFGNDENLPYYFVELQEEIPIDYCLGSTPPSTDVTCKYCTSKPMSAVYKFVISNKLNNQLWDSTKPDIPATAYNLRYVQADDGEQIIPDVYNLQYVKYKQKWGELTPNKEIIEVFTLVYNTTESTYYPLNPDITWWSKFSGGKNHYTSKSAQAYKNHCGWMRTFNVNPNWARMTGASKDNINAGINYCNADRKNDPRKEYGKPICQSRWQAVEFHVDKDQDLHSQYFNIEKRKDPDDPFSWEVLAMPKYRLDSF